MAHLSDGDRGQIILVAAFAIAVVFVALALIVNSAIFTENLASRGETAGSEGALSMRAMVEENAGESLEAVNRQNDTDEAALEDRFASSVANISDQTARQQARTGRVVTVEVLPSTFTDGRRIVQNDSGTFSAGSDTDYAVATGVERVAGGNGTRAFRINATDIAATDNSSAFVVEVNRSGATGNDHSWRAHIYRNGTDTVHVRTVRDNGTTTETADCEVTRPATSSTFRVDVTDGTVAGEPCDALGTTTDGLNFHFGAGTDPSLTYDIYFRNADQIRGNVSMTVHDGGLVSLPSTGLFGTGQPFDSNAVYDVSVRYTYATSDLRYETDIRVAPGEPDV